MSDNTVVEHDANSGNRWWLPALLALLILAIVGGAYFATHRNMFGGSPTPTPTPHLVTATPRPVTGTPKPGPTGTARPGPTGTPRSGPTGTPRPGPTGTPRPGPTGTVGAGAGGSGGVQTGRITANAAQQSAIQQGANRQEAQYMPYLDPFKVVQKAAPQYGFKGAVSTVAPPPQPTPTAFANTQGQPEVHITVAYNGHRYLFILIQPLQKGASGIWSIAEIRLIS